MKNKKGIIFAADIIDKSELLKTIEETAEFIDAIKVGNLVLYEHSWKIIEDIKRITNLPIIADLKLMDIPAIAEKVTKSAVEAGVDGIMVCGPAGADTITGCMCFIQDKMIFVFTEFTHPGGLIHKEMADQYIDIAVMLGCDGIQVPGTKEKRIREVRKKVGEDLIIICCGIGSQKYVDREGGIPDFGSAIAAGADYEIIGRSIYDMKIPNTTPRDVVRLAKEKILKSMND